MQVTLGTLNILHPEFAIRHNELAGLYPGTVLSNWETRKVNIVNEIGKANLDILCLQEISRSSLADMERPLEMQGYIARHVENPRGDGLAIIYKTNLFTEILFKPMSVNSNGIACILDLRNNASGKIARIGNCHLLGGPTGPEIGTKQLKEITAALELSPQSYIISFKAILGDFNEDQLHHDKKGELQKGKYVSDGAYVITEPGKSRQIDWIFVGQNNEQEVLELTDIPVPSFTMPTSDHHLKATRVKLM